MPFRTEASMKREGVRRDISARVIVNQQHRPMARGPAKHADLRGRDRRPRQPKRAPDVIGVTLAQRPHDHARGPLRCNRHWSGARHGYGQIDRSDVIDLRYVCRGVPHRGKAANSAAGTTEAAEMAKGGLPAYRNAPPEYCPGPVGRLVVLINNARIVPIGPSLEEPDEVARRESSSTSVA